MPVDIHHHNIDADMARYSEQWGVEIGEAIVSAGKERCPVDEGTLRASLDYSLEWGPDSMHVTVGSPLEYAEYIHTGTGVYGPRGTPIVPVTRKALKFRWEPTGPGASKRLPKERRGWYFAKSVKGIEPNPFLVDALRDVMGAIDVLR